MHQKKILTTALVASTIAGIGIVPAQNAEAASISSFVSNALAIANDNSHGYSMVNRWGPDYDCSSFVITCLKQAGFETGGATYSGNMVSNLTQHGFSYIPSSKIDLSSSSSLQAGDILMASGHTEIYIGNGKRVGAHRNYDGKTGDSGGNEINVLDYSRGSWYGILRYTGSGSTATAVTTAATTTSSGQTGAYKINANLNLRSGNSTSTSILTTIPKGTSVTVSQVSNGWGKTTYSGKTGWIYLSYATYSGNTASTASASTPAATTTVAATTAGTTYKTTANLNVRSGNSTSTSILTSIPKGTSVTVTEVKSNWGKTSYGGKTGWISLDYATKTGGTTTAAATTTKATTTAAATVAGTVYKTNGNMYLRAGNNKSSAVLGVVPAGTSVTATQISNNWGKITYGGKTGWMSLKYSTKTGTVAAPAATTAKATTTAAKTTTSTSAAKTGTTTKTTSFIYQTTSNLNLRSGNSTSYSKLSVVPRGTAVTVTEVKNNWGKISYGGKTGWISLDYASKKGSNVETTITTVVANVASSTSKTVTYSYTTTANLNLRKSYSTSSAKILTMPNGTSLTVTEIKNNWGKVNYKGNVGWMSLQYAICTGSQTTIKNVIGQTSSTPTLKTASVPATTSAVKTASVPAATSAVKTASVAASTSSVKLTTSAAPTVAVAAKSAASVSLASTAEPVSEAKTDQDAAKAEETKPVSFSMPVSVVNAFEDEEKTAEAAETVEEVKTEEAAEEVKAEEATAEETAADEAAVEETAAPEEAVVEAAEEETAVEETAEAEAADTEENEVETEETEAEDTEETEAEAEETEAEDVEAEAEEETEAEEAEAEEEEESTDAFAAGNYAAQKELRIYADAYDGADVLTTFEAGTVLEVTAENDGWGKVTIDGQTCWIRLADVEKTDASVTQGLTLQADTQDVEAASEDTQTEASDDEQSAEDGDASEATEDQAE